MSLCIATAAKTLVMAASAFTLSWTHSVEKIRWIEKWEVTPAGLEIVEGRVQGSGAGMDPPPGSVFEDGWWVYAPDLPPLPALNLASSGATVSGWQLCAAGRCETFGTEEGPPIRIAPCEPSDK